MADRELDAAIAVTRFGLGARPGELDDVRRDPQGWLKAQVRPEGADQPATSGARSQDRIAEFREYQQDKKAAKSDAAADKANGQVPDARDPVKRAQRMLRDETGVDFAARAQLAATTPAGFRERWALFWANHFTVSATKLATATVVGPFTWRYGWVMFSWLSTSSPRVLLLLSGVAPVAVSPK